MFSFTLGVVVGAAFAPFWMTVWAFIKETPAFKKIMSMVKKDNAT